MVLTEPVVITRLGCCGGGGALWREYLKQLEVRRLTKSHYFPEEARRLWK